MSISIINNQIRLLENEMISNNEEIRKLKKRINELKSIKGNLKRSDNKFSNYINSKRYRFKRLRNTLFNTKFVVQCSEDMLEFINGRAVKNAINDFSEAIREVDRVIYRKESYIDELESRNRYLYSKKISLINEKSRLIEEERIRRAELWVMD